VGVIKINLNPSRRQLALFGVVWLLFFGGVTAVVRSRGGSPPAVVALAALAVLVPAAGWVLPGLMRIVYVGMACLAFPIGFVVSYALLAAVYYLLITPMGLLLRMLGYDPMKRRFDAAAQSYWVPHEDNEDPERYFRQV
jgi:ABC-type uncharacterized transport system permease subunit